VALAAYAMMPTVAGFQFENLRPPSRGPAEAGHGSNYM
jgi:hypothetical protein